MHQCPNGCLSPPPGLGDLSVSVPFSSTLLRPLERHIGTAPRPQWWVKTSPSLSLTGASRSLLRCPRGPHPCSVLVLSFSGVTHRVLGSRDMGKTSCFKNYPGFVCIGPGRDP